MPEKKLCVLVGFLLGISFGSLGCVDCFPLNDFRMCPFAVASDFGRNFRKSCSVSPGHVERKLFFNCGDQCGCAWAPQRKVDKITQISF